MKTYECTECEQRIESPVPPRRPCKCGARGKWKVVGQKKVLKRGRKVAARIKWFDLRDGNGIAFEMNGTEFYIDTSSIKKGYRPKDGDFVLLNENLEVHDCRCGLDVRPCKVSEVTKREFQLASTLRNTQAYLRSANLQAVALRRARLIEMKRNTK